MRLLTLLLPPVLPPNLLLVPKLTVPYLILPKDIIVPDKNYPSIVISFTIIVLYKAIPPNLISLISPNTIIVLDKALALASNARYRYRTCSITALSPL